MARDSTPGHQSRYHRPMNFLRTLASLTILLAACGPTTVGGPSGSDSGVAIDSGAVADTGNPLVAVDTGAVGVDTGDRYDAPSGRAHQFLCSSSRLVPSG